MSNINVTPDATPEVWQALQKGEIKGADASTTIYFNDLYVVIRREMSEDGDTVHLSIRSQDHSANHDWRHFQRIKSELAGKEWEAVELYPAESRLVDTANQYHLWCSKHPFDLGWQERLVSDAKLLENAHQRPVPLDWEQTPVEVMVAKLQERMTSRENS